MKFDKFNTLLSYIKSFTAGNARILCFWLMTAAGYALLTPLWEGFDEPFHYAYGQWLATRMRIPALGSTPLSEEVWRSLQLAPGSHVVRKNLPLVTTYEEYNRLEEAERFRRRAQLRSIPPVSRSTLARGTNNYEAQQPPLGYLPIAVIDLFGQRAGLSARVRIARLFCVLAGGGLQVWLTLRLASQLSLEGHWRSLSLFLLAGLQTFHATFSRVSNDWLAVPLATAVILAVLRCSQAAGIRNAGLLGLILSAGLLTKAYFLVWVIFSVGVLLALPLARRAKWTMLAALAAGLLPAAPWYVRNLVLHGNLTGTLQAQANIGPLEVMAAAGEIPWLSVAPALFRGALWTGNNSFLSFSSVTLNAMLLLGGTALLLWVTGSFRKPSWRREWTAACGVAVFGASLLYANAMFFAQAHRSYYTSTPWYVQTLGPSLACLATLGMAGGGRLGRWLASALVAGTGYLIASTFWVKLIPLYSGYAAGRASPAQLIRHYRGAWWHSLAQLALGPVELLAPLAAGSTLLACACVLYFRPGRLPVSRRGPAC